MIQLHLGDCLEVMQAIEPASVALIVADPPYFKVKDEEWDHQWAKPAEFLAWVGQLCEAWHRILKPNGSLYCFASPRMAARVECKIGGTFEVLNRIRWVKEAGWHQKAEKEALRSYLSPWEEIIFAEHYGADSMALGESGYAAQCEKLRGFVFEPLRAYLEGERHRAGVDKAECNVACGFSPTPGGMASRHYFGRSQWQLPTPEHYAALRSLFNRAGDTEYLRREYEDLRREYEDLRRPFAVTADVPYTDVWDFPTVQAYKGKHVCEKPLAMMEHIVAASSRPGDLVLDPCMGSGVVGEACQRLGRSFLGIERSPHWYGQASIRLGSPRSAPPSSPRPAPRRPETASEYPLFAGV